MDSTTRTAATKHLLKLLGDDPVTMLKELVASIAAEKSETPKRQSKSKKSSKKSRARQDMPPYKHPTGRWVKKVGNRTIYLGTLKDDPTGERAQKIWNEQCHGIRAGRDPIIDPTKESKELTIKQLANEFLEVKEGFVKTGELAHRSWCDYKRTCQMVVDILGRNRLVSDLNQADLTMLRHEFSQGKPNDKGIRKNASLVTLRGHMTRTRVLFRWAYDADKIEKPIKMGQAFKLPSASTLRKARNEKPKKLFEQPELRKIIDACGVQMRAMVLLGINCGLGNADCARLQFRHIDLENGWLDFPRPKTSKDRRSKLWPETIDAIQQAIDIRKEPTDEALKDVIFLTKRRGAWHDDQASGSVLSAEFGKVLNKLKMRQTGVNFYSIRHTFMTVAEDCGDFPAIGHVMGHTSTGIDAHYRERVTDARLEAVSECVRKWLFAPMPTPKKSTIKKSTKKKSKPR